MFIVAMNAVKRHSRRFCHLVSPIRITSPHCIPMSHRGRLSGWGNGLGSGLAVISNSIAIYMLYKLREPESYGYLYIMTWIICQAGYIMALFGRETPPPLSKNPRSHGPKTMIKAAIFDKPFMRVIALQAYLRFPSSCRSSSNSLPCMVSKNWV